MISKLAFIILLSLLIIYISCIEVAFLTLNPQKLYKYRKTDKRAEEVIQLLNRKAEVISTFLAVFTILDVYFTILCTDISNEYFQDYAHFFQMFAVPFIILIFFEALPKNIIPFIADKVALNSIFITKVILFLFKLVLPIINFSIRSMLFILNIKTKKTESHITELKETLEHHFAQGNMVKDDKNMLENILSIENFTVEDIMKHRKEIISLSIDTPKDELMNQIFESRHTRFPIWKDNSENIIGILNLHLLFKELKTTNFNLNQIDINKCLITPIFIQLNTNLKDQISAFIEAKQHMAIIINEYGEIEGLITFEDIVEFIFGKIYDEKEREVIDSTITQIDDLTYLVNLDANIHFINQELDLNIEFDEAITINGLIAYKLNRIPEEGDKIIEKDYKISIVKKNNKKKACIKIIKNN